MTTQEIFRLLDAGYTKAEIEALDAAPADDPAPAGDPEPASWAGIEIMIADALKPLQSELSKTTAAIQAANRAAARQPEGGQVTVETIMADFFGKPQKGGR